MLNATQGFLLWPCPCFILDSHVPQIIELALFIISEEFPILLYNGNCIYNIYINGTNSFFFFSLETVFNTGRGSWTLNIVKILQSETFPQETDFLIEVFKGWILIFSLSAFWISTTLLKIVFFQMTKPAFRPSFCCVWWQQQQQQWQRRLLLRSTSTVGVPDAGSALHVDRCGRAPSGQCGSGRCCTVVGHLSVWAVAWITLRGVNYQFLKIMLLWQGL